MKNLLPILALLLLVGCSNEVPRDKLVERGGVYYEVNSQTPFTGSSVRWHGNGQLEGRTHFKDGKLHGLAEAYDEDGNPTFNYVWKDGKILKSSMYMYYENGQLLSKANFNEDTEFDGLYETYYKNGQLEEKRNFKDGEGIGLFESYYENGQLEEKGNYKDGGLDGLQEIYHENGQIKWKANYKDGNQDGLTLSYDKNGRLVIESNYKDGKLINSD